MTREDFRKLTGQKNVILDGATGSNLQQRGMPVGVCPENWILEHARVLIDLQKEYVRAGTDILYAPTFSGNRIKLKEYGLEDKIAAMNRDLVGLSQKAAEEAKQEGTDRPVYVAGDLTMTGQQLYPVGTMDFEELVDIYKEQIAYMLMAGVDLIAVETMMSLQECRAALLAVKETCDLPVMVTLTFREDMRTLYGTDPATAILVMESMGADAVGVNCSTGPDQMQAVIRKMKEFAYVPLIAKPNAGLPHLKDGITVYDMGPEEFAAQMAALAEAGVGITGGCCGTTPEHIRMLAERVKCIPVPVKAGQGIRALSTERRVLPINLEGRFYVVGERINPTGKKALQAELRQGNLDLAASMAEEQVENGADILDINMGMNGIDEKDMMVRTVYEVNRVADVPLCIDSSHVPVIEAALRIYPGRALINSISLEKEKFEKLIPIAKKYGAMFILLPLSDQGLPKDIGEKKEIIHKILNRACSIGLSKNDIIVDGLVNTVGANKRAAYEVLDTIRYCKNELGLATICGLSNISFGLPQRQFVNSTFLALAIKDGLTMAISNPSQELLMNTAMAVELLLDREEADIRYISRVTSHTVNITSKVAQTEKQQDVKQPQEIEAEDPVYEAVIKGNRKYILELLQTAMDGGREPVQIINGLLIPAINRVGELFNKQVYFLPQLISSAETMKKAIDFLEPMLNKEETGEEPATIIMATVSGDIHDIGKNLVVLMLKNYGFEVIDLGKDVPAELIIKTAREKDADIIGLSALMTTTMMEMKRVVELSKKEGLRARIIIGGAVITESFAEEIGADGYSTDAGEAVKLVKRLLNIQK